MRTIAALGAFLGVEAFQRQSKHQSAHRDEGRVWLDDLFPCAAGDKVRNQRGYTPTTLAKQDYMTLYSELKKTFTDLATCNENFDDCPRSDFAGCVLRIVGHDIIDYNTSSPQGALDGCVDLSVPINFGIKECVEKNDGILLSMFEQHCTKISLTDYLALASKVVIENNRDLALKETDTLSGNHISIDFVYGRQAYSSEGCETRFLDGEIGIAADPEDPEVLNRIFIDELGFDKRATAALLSLHGLGQARYSGYEGWWKTPQTVNYLDNQYFSDILVNGFMPADAITTDDGRELHQWRISNAEAGETDWFGSSTYTTKHGKRVMLDTDIGLVHTEVAGGEVEGFTVSGEGEGFQPRLRPAPLDGHEHIEAYRMKPVHAKTTKCCAWLDKEVIQQKENDLLIYSHVGKHLCHTTEPATPHPGTDQRVVCCDGQEDPIADDCGYPFRPEGWAVDAVLEFANDEGRYMHVLAEAFYNATYKGYGYLSPV